MAYTGLYNADGQPQVTIVPGSTYTGVYSVDGQYNGVISNGSVYVGRYHPCGAYNVTITTDLSKIGTAPDGSMYIVASPNGYAVSGIGRPVVITNIELREDGGKELREDGGLELRN